VASTGSPGLRLRRRLPAGDGPDMGPRHRVVGDTREQAAQFDRRGEFAVLTKTARIVVATVSVTRNMGRTMPRRSAPSNRRFHERACTMSRPVVRWPPECEAGQGAR
jgi:hypothetical protein